MKAKRGQLTLFIIIAIVIVAASLAGWLFYQRYQRVREEKIAQETALIKTYVQENIEKATIKSLIWIGLQGGYSEIVNSDKKILENIPYYYHKGQILVPSLDTVEDHLSRDVERRIKKINFSEFSNIKISVGNISVNTLINEEKVEFTVTWPIIILYNNETTVKLKEIYAISHPLRIKRLITIAENLTKEVAKNPKYVPIVPLSYFQEKYDIIITPFILEKDVIYKMDDQKFKLKNQPYYTFQFAVKT